MTEAVRDKGQNKTRKADLQGIVAISEHTPTDRLEKMRSDCQRTVLRPWSATKLFVDGREECRIRITTGQGNPDFADADTNLRSNLEQLQPDRCALCFCHFGSLQSQSPQSMHQ